MEREENKIMSQGVLIKTCKLELKVHSFFVKKFCTENFDFAGMLPCFCVQYLLSNLTKMNEKHFNALAREWPVFLQLRLDMYRCGNIPAYKDVLQVLMEITQRSSFYCYELTNGTDIEELFKHVTEKNIDPKIKYNILRILLNLTFSADSSSSKITSERIAELMRITSTDFNDREKGTEKCWNAENNYLILSILSFEVTASDTVTDAFTSSLIKLSIDSPLKLRTSDIKLEKIEEALRPENDVISKIWWSLLTIENLLKNDRKVFLQRYKQRGMRQMVKKLLERERLQQDVGLLEYAKRVLKLA
ncbi:hypothetical protein CAEBREN_21963 [Caenorhabditis brenneri]|uniref:Uncharacterized protein n=1 Tax=Caenorhabditis brenneri TaxID=135651 RepID=G0PDE2_CAEBE|nr:hypothetical protein CAEBREN_21963 [Caenorhabditis brenneri]